MILEPGSLEVLHRVGLPVVPILLVELLSQWKAEHRQTAALDPERLEPEGE
jgi:hypothetical protein